MHVVLNFLEQLVCMFFKIFWNSLCACCFKFSGTACVHVVFYFLEQLVCMFFFSSSSSGTACVHVVFYFLEQLVCTLF